MHPDRTEEAAEARKRMAAVEWALVAIVALAAIAATVTTLVAPLP